MKTTSPMLETERRLRVCRARLLEDAARLEILAAENQRKALESWATCETFGLEVQAYALRMVANELRSDANALEPGDLSPELEASPTLHLLQNDAASLEKKSKDESDESIAASYRLERIAFIFAIRWLEDHPMRTIELQRLPEHGVSSSRKEAA